MLHLLFVYFLLSTIDGLVHEVRFFCNEIKRVMKNTHESRVFAGLVRQSSVNIEEKIFIANFSPTSLRFLSFYSSQRNNYNL